MLDAITGYDPEDHYTVAASISPKPSGGSYTTNLHAEPNLTTPYRIGLLHQCFGPDTDPSSHSTNLVIRHALQTLSSKKFLILIDIETPDLEDILTATDIFLSRSRYDI